MAAVSKIDILIERIERLALELDELKKFQANSMEQAEADRAIMVELLRVIEGQLKSKGRANNFNP